MREGVVLGVVEQKVSHAELLRLLACVPHRGVVLLIRVEDMRLGVQAVGLVQRRSLGIMP